MNTLAETIRSARFSDGYIVIELEGGVQIRFPIKGNPRLESATEAQLNRIELSPFGLHWPELDEDLSLDGISRGDFGQHQKRLSKP